MPHAVLSRDIPSEGRALTQAEITRLRASTGRSIPANCIVLRKMPTTTEIGKVYRCPTLSNPHDGADLSIAVTKYIPA